MTAAALDLLHRLRAHHAGGAELDPEFAAATVAAIDGYLSGAARGVTLDEAFGIAAPSYVQPWWKAATDDRRRVLVQRLAEHFRQADQTNTARAIASAAERYAASEWTRRDHRID